MADASLHARLQWEGDLRFAAESGQARLVLDSQGLAGPSPVQALALALAGCMAVDVVDIIMKGRHQLTALSLALEGDRLADPPRRFTRFTLHYTITGAVPPAAAERAIKLSREKYCSVWHSLRQDIALDVTFTIQT